MIYQDILQEPEWRKAATLTERLAALRSLHLDPASMADTPRARRMFEKWRTQPPFDTEDYFARRLTLDGTNEDELPGLLGQADDLPCLTENTSSWLQDMAKAFSRPPSPSPPASDLPYFQETAGFLGAVEPLMALALERLLAGAQTLAKAGSEPPFTPGAVPAMFAASLGARLLAMLNRTMILELNVARLEGGLHGDSAEERFQSFLGKLRDRDFSLGLLREYPVLARQIVVRIDQWLAFSLEFLQSLCTDWKAIQAAFSSGGDPGKLVKVRTGMGDSHRGGRSVLIARFSSGFQIVYKPRPLSLDAHFQELLEWINRRGHHLGFRTLKILDCGRYGWAEFVAAKACNSAEEVERFYERQGGYLALLYAWEASDFHFENIVAAGEDPFLIDLEALCHPRLAERSPHQASEPAGNALDYSVLRVGLLPGRVFEKQENEKQEDEGLGSADTSGLGGAGGQLTPGAVPWLEKTGTDEMHIARKRVMMPERENRPSLAGAEVHVPDYSDAILRGFTNVYRTILQHREELLASGGPLSWFENDQARVVLRPTEVYALLLRESFHPDMLRDALDRDRFFDYLWAGVKSDPDLEKVIMAERHDLLHGDVPIFTTRPSSHDLWSGTNQRFASFLPRTGLDLVKQRLRRLNEDDLNRQIWFIQASLTSLTVGQEPAHRPRRDAHSSPEPATPERLIAEAIRVGERLQNLALHAGHEASWVGVGLVNERAWSVLPLGPKLYDGLPGVILFLAYLGSITSRNDFVALARAALVTLRRQLGELPANTPIGGYSGLGGIIYVLCHLSALWNEEELLDEAEKIVERLPARIERDDYLDMMGGSAGCLAALLVLYRLRPSERVLSIAVQCGGHLVRAARPMQQGAGWLVKGVARAPMTGLSHGAAGIAWTLLELASLTGTESFRQAALAGLAYERGLFLPEEGNWPDLRRDPPENGGPQATHCGMMWCHGAPGIGLARLNMLPHLRDPEIETEIEIALRTTLRHGFGLNHCLCHGDLGNLEPILQASLVLNDPCWREEVDRLAAIVLDSVQHDGWLCGTPSNVETPGLMTGLAGIGYELLRLAEPLRAPSVLLLAPPFLKTACLKPTLLKTAAPEEAAFAMASPGVWENGGGRIE